MALNRSPSGQGVNHFFSKSLSDESAIALLHYIQKLGWQIPGQAIDFDVYFTNLAYLLGLVRREYPAYPKERQLEHAKQLALKLSVIFGSHGDMLEYLARCEKQTRRRGLIEDAGLFSLPETSHWNPIIWREIIKRQHPSSAKDKIMQLVSWMDKLENKITSQTIKDIYQHIDNDYATKFKNSFSSQDELQTYLMSKHGERRSKDQADKWRFGAKLSFVALKTYAMHIQYGRANENKIAADLFAKFNRTEKSLNDYLDLLPVTKKNLPDIYFWGDVLHNRYSRYYMTSISADDPIAALLGRMSGCCQSIGDDGEETVVHGITSPNGSFYALYHQTIGNKKELVAQCWAWLSREGYIVFDSIEVNPNFIVKDLSALVSDFFLQLAYELIVHHQVPRVLLGVDRWVPEGISGLLTTCQPVDYDGFRDSAMQIMIADSQLPIMCLRRKGGIDYSLYSYMTLINIADRYSAIYQWCDLCLLNGLSREYFDTFIVPYANFLQLDKYKIVNYIDLHFDYMKVLKRIHKTLHFKLSGDLHEQGLIDIKVNISKYIYRDYSKGINNQLVFQGFYLFKLLVDLGWWDIIDNLVEQGASLKKEYFDDEEPVLHLAVKAGRLAFVAAYLKANPDAIFCLNHINETALHVAAEINNFNLVILLLNAGVDYRAKAFDRFAFELTGLVAIQAHILNYHSDKDKQEAVFAAVKENNYKLFSLLLSNGISVSGKNKKGETLLHVAMKSQDLNFATILINHHHLSLSIRNYKNITPWQLLYQHDAVNILFFLACLPVNKVKAVVNIQDINGETLLHVAARANWAYLVDQLVLYGADIGLVNRRNITPKQLAIDRQVKQAMLLKAGGRTASNLFHSPSDAGVDKSNKKAKPKLKRRHTK